MVRDFKTAVVCKDTLLKQFISLYPYSPAPLRPNTSPKIPSCRPLAASTRTVPITIQYPCLGYSSSSLQGSSSISAYSHFTLWCTSWLPRTASQHYLTQLKFCSFRLDSYSRKARARSYIGTRHSSNPIIPLYLITIGPGTKTKWRLTSDPSSIISSRVIGQRFHSQRSGKSEVRHIGKCPSPNTPRRTGSCYHQKRHQRRLSQYPSCSTPAMATRFSVEQKILSGDLSIVWLVHLPFYLQSLWGRFSLDANCLSGLAGIRALSGRLHTHSGSDTGNPIQDRVARNRISAFNRLPWDSTPGSQRLHWHNCFGFWH